MTGLNSLIPDPRLNEGAGIGTEQGVAGFDQSRYRTLIVTQAGDSMDLSLGLQIGVDIRIAKAVDGLLWIAHEKKRHRAIPVDAQKDSALQGVGILKFVDQGGGVASTQCGGELRLFATTEGVPGIEQNVVIGNDIIPALVSLQIFAADLDHRAQEGEQAALTLRAQRLTDVQQALGGIKERMRRCGLAAQGPFLQGQLGEQVRFVVRGKVKQRSCLLQQYCIPSLCAVEDRARVVATTIELVQAVTDSLQNLRPMIRPDRVGRGPRLVKGEGTRQGGRVLIIGPARGGEGFGMNAPQEFSPMCGALFGFAQIAAEGWIEALGRDVFAPEVGNRSQAQDAVVFD